MAMILVDTDLSLSPDTVTFLVVIYELPVFACETIWELEGKKDKHSKTQLRNQ